MRTLLNSKGAPKAPISTAAVCEFWMAKSSCNWLFFKIHCRVMFNREFEGRVGERFAAARVDPDIGKATTGLRAVEVSPLSQVVDPTFRTRKVMSPRW